MTIQTTALLRSARILRRVLELCGDLLSLSPVRKLSTNASVKNSQKSDDNNNYTRRLDLTIRTNGICTTAESILEYETPKIL